MPLEHAIRLGTMSFSDLEETGALENALDRFSWFYLGGEFCENLLEETLCGDIVRFQKKGKKVCLLTPPLSEKGVFKLKKIFSVLRALEKSGKADFSRLELSINDFAALELARACKIAVKISAGRIFYENVVDQSKKHVGVISRQALDLFSSLGIKRYEVSVAGRDLSSNFNSRIYGLGKLDFNLTFYYPYFNMTTTRACLVGMQDIRPHQSIEGINCLRECRACTFEVAHPWIKEKLLIRGNTVFIEFPGRFYSSEKELEKIRVDRLVYCPFP
ncbi:MAG: hypothetical protein NTX59_07800 [Elusimicrobia bacterium]|nr:hypothetical protein [Elusimicrobiota bacterium]